MSGSVEVVPCQCSCTICTGLVPCSLTLNAAAGLFYEAAVESVYPIDEVVTSSALTLPFNIATALYTFLGSRISPKAMNWVLTGCCAGCTLGLVFLKELKRRQRVDNQALDGKSGVITLMDDGDECNETTPLKLTAGSINNSSGDSRDAMAVGVMSGSHTPLLGMPE